MRNSIKILTGLSHEMRSDLNAIVGFSYIIEQKRTIPTEEQELAGKILSSCTQLIWLMDNFLNSEIIEIGVSENSIVRSNLKTFWSQVNRELPDILSKIANNDILLKIDDTCPGDEEIFIDTQKVTRIIKALFINAVNSMERGIIRLGYSYNRKELKFSIADSGQDYEKCREFLLSGNIDRSMSKFYDARSAINIILARKLVNLMGGTIMVRPDKPSGTCYTISIPVRVEIPFKSRKMFNSQNAF